jgi:hypothetical protein
LSSRPAHTTASAEARHDEQFFGASRSLKRSLHGGPRAGQRRLPSLRGEHVHERLPPRARVRVQAVVGLERKPQR